MDAFLAPSHYALRWIKPELFAQHWQRNRLESPHRVNLDAKCCALARKILLITLVADA